jgi:dipeptidyl aminopeptidase/acylaminoacyl peptidase
MWSHGGFNGIGALDRDLCQRMAEAGYVAGLSEYRGEGGSDGRIEFCLGEVDDVERLLEILTSQPYVDGARIAVLGASHGGCITTRLALRRPSLSAAVDYVGPGDLATLYDWWSEQLARGEPFCRSVGRSGCAEQHALYVAITTTALGGPPATKPEAYVSRSPIRDLAALRVPMLFIHGADDEIVGVEQACQKRSALETAQRPLQAWALDTQLQPNPAAALCGGRFRADIVPASLSDDLYLFLFERQGHNLSSSTIDYSWTLTLSFLASHL